ncbi:hypothetical protein GQ53DRAFT_600346, partial [Thozetella sp. PMI_491]
QVRLVRLDPGSRGSPIICEILPSSLEPSPEPYECLLYMWGPSVNSKSISMNNRTIQVRQNLWAALEAIRYETTSRTSRVDALCINQNDAPEVNTPVAIMGLIFHGALKVLVWLGETADDNDLLFRYIK